MKAIYLTKTGEADKAFEIRETQIPKASKGEIVVKVHAFGLNFADVLARRGMYPDAPKIPSLLGYDVSGEIHEIGEGVTGFLVGQKVVALTRFGGYAEFVTTKWEAVALLPDSYDMTKATALATQACTAYFCAEECVSLHEGDHVLVHAAAGGVGSILVQLAKHRKCYVVSTASTKKQEFMRENGVDLPIDYTKQDFHAVIKEKLGDKILDVAFDSLGGQIYKKSKKLLAPGGRIVLFGAAEQMQSIKNKLKLLGLATGFGLTFPVNLLMESQSIITVNMLRIADHRPHVFNKVLNNVVRLAKQGVINPTLGKEFPADQIGEAHHFLESRASIGKVALRW